MVREQCSVKTLLVDYEHLSGGFKVNLKITGIVEYVVGISIGWMKKKTKTIYTTKRIG